jgi:hypothetical protein
MTSCTDSQLEKSCLFKCVTITFVLLYCIWFGIIGVCAHYNDPRGLECQITQYLAFILLGSSFGILVFGLCCYYSDAPKEPVMRPLSSSPLSSTPFSSEVIGSAKSPRLRSDTGIEISRVRAKSKSPLRSERV